MTNAEITIQIDLDEYFVVEELQNNLDSIAESIVDDLESITSQYGAVTGVRAQITNGKRTGLAGRGKLAPPEPESEAAAPKPKPKPKRAPRRKKVANRGS